jgi:hypothetical protein
MVKVVGKFSRMKDAVAKADDRAQVNWGLPERERPITCSPCTPFFGVAKMSVAKVAERMSASVARRREKVTKATIADPKLDVTEPKGGGLAGGNRVFFTRVKEIEESDAAHVGDAIDWRHHGEVFKQLSNG